MRKPSGEEGEWREWVGKGHEGKESLVMAGLSVVVFLEKES